MKTKLPKSIKTVEDAKKFLTDLHVNNESYNPDDNADDIYDRYDNKLFTAKESKKLDELMGQIFALEGFCPYEFILNQL